MMVRPIHMPARARLSPRCGAVPLWIPVALVVLAVGIGAVLLERSALERGVARVDLAHYRLHHGQAWFSQDWRQELEDLLLRHGALLVTDHEARAALRADILALPFVAQVEPGEVLWPAGLTLRVRLVEPIACVRVGQEFLPMAADGRLLPGWSDAPHQRGPDFLPMLLPTPLEWEQEDPFIGEPTSDSLLLSALSLARSFLEHLNPDQRALFGRVVFDVSAGDAPDGLEGGAVLRLEGERLIEYGDSPLERGPGELPDRIKWDHAVEGLLDAAEGAAWEVLDVRWDVAERDR